MKMNGFCRHFYLALHRLNAKFSIFFLQSLSTLLQLKMYICCVYLHKKKCRCGEMKKIKRRSYRDLRNLSRSSYRQVARLFFCWKSIESRTQEFDALRVHLLKKVDLIPQWQFVIADHERRALGRFAALAERFLEFDCAAGEERVPVHSSSNWSHDAGSAPRWVSAVPHPAPRTREIRAVAISPRPACATWCAPFHHRFFCWPLERETIFGVWFCLQGWSGSWKCRGFRSKSSWWGWRPWPITSIRRF